MKLLRVLHCRYPSQPTRRMIYDPRHGLLCIGTSFRNCIIDTVDDRYSMDDLQPGLSLTALGWFCDSLFLLDRLGARETIRDRWIRKRKRFMFGDETFIVSVENDETGDRYFCLVDQQDDFIDKYFGFVNEPSYFVDKYFVFVNKSLYFVDKQDRFVDKHFCFVDKHSCFWGYHFAFVIKSERFVDESDNFDAKTWR